ncbi:hypothetical protein BDP81DRAFT_428759 [Colletotrichum phormii]|uniref:Uncharacterized protein n=1 Tax=Colletotrichum phormii TaxID=359342 RepID=A0AAJ0EEE7_9PEZI|nr:uncharacterized protein BDP81DRAFT_428759 [Colletotrichum phormii]KAK1635949.1 hypothetical protein BDP81DRAFT_428759 [Colletotrichum phormii]
MHNSVRFGLMWAAAVRVRDGLRNRVWFEPRGRRGGEGRRGELFCFLSWRLYLLGFCLTFLSRMVSTGVWGEMMQTCVSVGIVCFLLRLE